MIEQLRPVIEYARAGSLTGERKPGVPLFANLPPLNEKLNSFYAHIKHGLEVYRDDSVASFRNFPQNTRDFLDNSLPLSWRSAEAVAFSAVGVAIVIAVKGWL